MAELHVIYRPQNWEEVFGNEALKKILMEKIENQDLPRAILFHGPAGCGKTTLARLLANLLGCSDLNVYEQNIANNTGVDDMRKLLQTVILSPIVKSGEKKIKIYILDEFHRATPNAQDALLKPLEEVSEYTYFFICTTELHKVTGTIKSRCTKIQVEPLSTNELVELLEWVCENEDKQISRKVLLRIANVVNGVPRDALKLLDVSINVDEQTALEIITSCRDDEAKVIDICRILLDREKSKWERIAPKIKILDLDPERARLAILNYFVSVALNNKGEKAKSSILVASNFDKPYFHNGKAGLALSLFSACLDLGG